MSDAVEPRERLDKWLWRARFYKTRGLAASAVREGKIRINGVRNAKPSANIRVEDVLTIARSGRVTVVKILAFGERRGPPAEAQTLYVLIEA